MSETIEEKGTKKRKKRHIIAPVAIILLIAAALYIAASLRRYKSTETVSSTKIVNASQSQYLRFGKDILRYNGDGAILADESMNTLWNETYEMSDPRAVLSGKYLIIYDKKGSKIKVMTKKGIIREITTNMPVVSCDVSGNGVISVLMQDENTGHLMLYGSNGKVIASGEIHLNNKGYPVAQAISQDGRRVMLSILTVKNGSLKTTIDFYNFGKSGRTRIDNVSKEYTYDGVFPEVDFVKGGRALAIGDKKIVLYDSSDSPKEKKIIKPGNKMKSVFHNDSYVGYAADEKDDDNELKNTIELYSVNGMRCFKKPVDMTYDSLYIMDDNEVVLSDGRTVTMYNRFGVKHFSYTFKNTVYKIIPRGKANEYMIITQDSAEGIRLR